MYQSRKGQKAEYSHELTDIDYRCYRYTTLLQLIQSASRRRYRNSTVPSHGERCSASLYWRYVGYAPVGSRSKAPSQGTAPEAENQFKS